MNKTKAIIIGGGIGGSTAALFLKRAGIEVQVYEARQEADSYAGLFLNLACNGIEILKSVGIDAPLRAEGSPAPRMMIWNARGKQMGEVRNGARDGLTESVLIRRGALQGILHDAVLKQGTPIHFGKKLRHIDTSDGVSATFEDGSTASGDLLIGADGIHSRVRQFLNSDAPAPAYTGLISTVGFTTQLNLPPTARTQHFIFGKRAFFGYHVRASGEVYWFNNHGQASEPDAAELSGTPTDEWRRRLLEMHADDMPLIQDIIQATEDGISAFPIYDIATQPIWHRGNSSTILRRKIIHMMR